MYVSSQMLVQFLPVVRLSVQTCRRPCASRLGTVRKRTSSRLALKLMSMRHSNTLWLTKATNIHRYLSSLDETSMHIVLILEGQMLFSLSPLFVIPTSALAPTRIFSVMTLMPATCLRNSQSDLDLYDKWSSVCSRLEYGSSVVSPLHSGLPFLNSALRCNTISVGCNGFATP